MEIRDPKHQPDVDLIRAELDPGERDAVLLAMELEANELIIYDMDGRRTGAKLHFIGTLGVAARPRSKATR